MFETLYNGIKTFFETNLPGQITIINSQHEDITVLPPNKYVIDTFDAERYSEKIVFYIQPADYQFENYTNESEMMSNSVSIICTFRGDKSDNLTKIALRYMEAIYRLVKDNYSLGGLIDDCRISEAHVYAGVEASESTKAIEITLLISQEID